jgi:hypothetical protein
LKVSPTQLSAVIVTLWENHTQRCQTHHLHSTWIAMTSCHSRGLHGAPDSSGTIFPQFQAIFRFYKHLHPEFLLHSCKQQEEDSGRSHDIGYWDAIQICWPWQTKASDPSSSFIMNSNDKLPFMTPLLTSWSSKQWWDNLPTIQATHYYTNKSASCVSIVFL